MFFPLEFCFAFLDLLHVLFLKEINPQVFVAHWSAIGSLLRESLTVQSDQNGPSRPRPSDVRNEALNVIGCLYKLHTKGDSHPTMVFQLISIIGLHLHPR